MKKKNFLLMGLLCLSVTVFCNTPPYLLQPQNQLNSLSQSETFRWVANNDLKNYELKIYECDYENGNVSNSINLGEFELLREKDISNGLQGSGLTWTEGSTTPLIVCANEYQQIDAYGASLTRHIINRLFGFSTFVENYRGITHLYNDHYSLIDEATGKIMYFDFIFKTFANITYPLIQKYDLNVDINRSEEGLEGIAYNQFNNSLYVAKEKSPMQLFEFKAAAAPDFTSGQSNLTQPFDLEAAAKKWGIKNVSGLFHLSKSSELNGTQASNNLLVLSSESKILIECDLQGNEISRLNFNNNGANGTLSTAIASAQGIAYANGIIYILSSGIPEEGIPAKFHTFVNNKREVNTADLGKQIYSKSNLQGDSYTVNNLDIDSNKMYCWNIEGTDASGQKTNSNYFSFGEETVEPPKPEETITLKKPYYNAEYRPGDIIDIEWEQSVDFKVNVYFYKGSVVSRTPVFNFDGRRVQFEVPSNAGTGDNYSIRIASLNDESNYASVGIKIDAGLNVPLGLGPGGITITSSFLGKTYLPGEILPLRWDFDSNDKVIIKLKFDNIEEYEIANDLGNSGYFDFKIPKMPESSSYSVEIISAKYSKITAESEKFTIAPKAGISNVNLTNGSLGDESRYMPGEDITITWNDQIPGDVKIQLLLNNGVFVNGFTGNTKSDGTEQITIKTNLPIANDETNYKIRVISADDKQIYAYSKSFKIVEQKAFNFISPINTNYNTEDLLIVRWTQLLENNIEGLDRVKITLWQEDEIVKEITSNTSNDGLYYWFPNAKDGDFYYLVLESTTIKGLASMSPFFSFKNGEAKLMQQPDFVVAPNPAANFVNVSFKNTLDGDIYLKLYTANGVCLKDLVVNKENLQLDVSSLSSGYYILNMKNKEYSINKKILIE